MLRSHFWFVSPDENFAAECLLYHSLKGKSGVVRPPGRGAVGGKRGQTVLRTRNLNERRRAWVAGPLAGAPCLAVVPVVFRYGINSTMNFLDPTPLDNSEFTMSSANATLGGGQVNVSRFGNATALGGAAGRYDVLTVDLHEIEHSLGYSSGLDRFLNLAGATGTAGRQLTVPTSLSGLPSSFNIPIVPNSAHIDGGTQGGLFNDTIVAEPGFDVGQRALPTDVEILGLGVIEGATPSQIHLGPNAAAVPEPGPLALLALGLLPVARRARRRRAA